MQPAAPEAAAPEAAPAAPAAPAPAAEAAEKKPKKTGSSDFLEGVEDFFGEVGEKISNTFSGNGEGLNFGSIAGGGVFAAILYFVASAFGPVGNILKWPLAILGVFMGANAGREWWGRGDGDDSPSVSKRSKEPYNLQAQTEHISAVFARVNGVKVAAAAAAGVTPAADAPPVAPPPVTPSPSPSPSP